MSETRKTYNSADRALDLQLKEIVDTLTGRAGKNLVVLDPDTGTRYSLTVAVIAGTPTLTITPI